MKNKLLLFAAFTLIVFKAFSQSDIPCNAPFLIVHPSNCTFNSGTTLGAAYQSNAANGGIPACASPGSPDVWYRFIVPFGGAVAITTTQGTILDGGMAVYRGSCNNLQFIQCDDNTAGNTMPAIDRSDYIPGDTIYVRFWQAWNIGTGTFNICAIESHSDCISATFICSQKHYPRNTFGPGSTVEANSAYNCGIDEYQSQWIHFNFLTGGTFQFTIFPDSLPGSTYPDYDWMLFKDTTSSFCSTYSFTNLPYVCNSSSSMGAQGSTGLDVTGVSNSVPPGPGNPFCPIMNVNANDAFYLFINNFSITSTGYSLNFGGTAQMSCNPNVGINQINKSSINIHIFPNPASNKITFEISESAYKDKLNLSIVNILGETVSMVSINSVQTIIPFDDFNPGLYFYQLKNESKVIKTGKIIIE